MRSPLPVLKARGHQARLQQKSTLPGKPKFSIGAYAHYRDFTRNRPKWVAGKVTGHVGKKMFIVQGHGGHYRRHEDQLKLNSQRRLKLSGAFDADRHTKTDQQRYDNGVPECHAQQPDGTANEELPVLVDQLVLHSEHSESSWMAASPRRLGSCPECHEERY